MKNSKIIYFMVFVLLIVSAFFINPIYCKYTSSIPRTITINIRKPVYTVVFNSNAPAGKSVSGSMANQRFAYGIAQNLRDNAYSINGYEFVNWRMSSGNNYLYFLDKANVNNLTSVDNSEVTLSAMWNYIATPVITRYDYNTFTYNAISADAYYVSTSNTKPDAGNTTASSSFALNTWTTATNTGDLTLSANQVYYVWAKDAVTGGNVSSNSASLVVRTVNRSQATGSTLTTKLDNSSGVSLTNSANYVFDGTSVYASVTASSGYYTPILQKDGTQITNGSTFVINQNTTFTSSVTATSATININKDGAAWSASSMKITLYSGTTATSYSSTVTSGSSAVFTAVGNGTYNVYAGKDSGNKTTLIDTGVDVVINNNSVTGTINYYSLTLIKGTGISAVSNGGEATTNAKQYLYVNGGTQQAIAINATVSAGYTWSTWSKTAGTNPGTFTAASISQTIRLGQGAVTLTATATPVYLVDKVSIGQYVDYPISYKNVKGTSGLLASGTGWRVLSKSGSGSSGYVILVSEGSPLTYRFTSKTDATTTETEVARLRTTDNTGFFSIGMNTGTLTDKKFHNCGFSGISSTSALRSLFINDYTQVNTYDSVQYPRVRAMTKNDLDTAYKALSGATTNTAHGTSLTKYNLLALSSTTSGKYAPYVLANKVSLDSGYYLWTVYDQGKVVETAGDQGIRIVVYLKTGVKTSGGTGTSGNKWKIVT